jgi:hypothetical protein
MEFDFDDIEMLMSGWNTLYNGQYVSLNHPSDRERLPVKTAHEYLGPMHIA